MLAVSKRITQQNIELRSGIWRGSQTTGVELANRTAFIVGEGNIGSKAAKLLNSIGIRVLSANSKTSEEVFNRYVKGTDYLVLNLPLNENTRNLINKDRLDLLRESAFIVHTARGEIIDQKALFDKLSKREIAGAALDVFSNEPLKGSPAKETVELVNLDNVVATPHVGFDTLETQFRLGEEIITNYDVNSSYILMGANYRMRYTEEVIL